MPNLLKVTNRISNHTHTHRIERVVAACESVVLFEGHYLFSGTSCVVCAKALCFLNGIIYFLARRLLFVRKRCAFWRALFIFWHVVCCLCESVVLFEGHYLFSGTSSVVCAKALCFLNGIIYFLARRLLVVCAKALFFLKGIIYFLARRLLFMRKRCSFWRALFIFWDVVCCLCESVVLFEVHYLFSGTSSVVCAKALCFLKGTLTTRTTIYRWLIQSCFAFMFCFRQASLIAVYLDVYFMG